MSARRWIAALRWTAAGLGLASGLALLLVYGWLFGNLVYLSRSAPILTVRYSLPLAVDIVAVTAVVVVARRSAPSPWIVVRNFFIAIWLADGFAVFYFAALGIF